MGNARTLSLIANAAKKLERLDPEYAAQMRVNRVAATAPLRKARKAGERATRIFLDSIRGAGFHDHDPIFSTLDPRFEDAFDAISVNDNGRSPQPAPKTETAKMYDWNGKSLTMAGWATELGITYGTLRSRIVDHHWPLDRALTSKLYQKPKKVFVPNPMKQPRVQRVRSTVTPRLTQVIQYNGQCLSIGQWATELGISQYTIQTRLKRGWTTAQALNVRVGALCGAKGSERNRIKSIADAFTGGGWVETSNDNGAGDRPHSLDSSLKQDLIR